MSGTDDDEVADLVRRVGGLGPYFAVSAPSGDGWLPLHDLTRGNAARERVEHAREVIAARSGLVLADVDLRACASITFLGLASRLVAPVLGAAALTATVPHPREVRWQRVERGPVPMAWTDVTFTAPTDVDGVAEALDAGVLSYFVRPLAAAFAREFALSDQVLRGNVASALAGTAAMISRAADETRLDPADVVVALTSRGWLAGSGGYVTPFADQPSRFFVRHNCCLFYRVPGGGTCGDCVLVPRAEREVLWRDTLTR